MRRGPSSLLSRSPPSSVPGPSPASRLEASPPSEPGGQPSVPLQAGRYVEPWRARSTAGAVSRRAISRNGVEEPLRGRPKRRRGGGSATGNMTPLCTSPRDRRRATYHEPFVDRGAIARRIGCSPVPARDCSFCGRRGTDRTGHRQDPDRDPPRPGRARPLPGGPSTSSTAFSASPSNPFSSDAEAGSHNGSVGGCPKRCVRST